MAAGAAPSSSRSEGTVRLGPGMHRAAAPRGDCGSVAKLLAPPSRRRGRKGAWRNSTPRGAARRGRGGGCGPALRAAPAGGGGGGGGAGSAPPLPRPPAGRALGPNRGAAERRGPAAGPGPAATMESSAGPPPRRRSHFVRRRVAAAGLRAEAASAPHLCPQRPGPRGRRHVHVRQRAACAGGAAVLHVTLIVCRYSIINNCFRKETKNSPRPPQTTTKIVFAAFLLISASLLSSTSTDPCRSQELPRLKNEREQRATNPTKNPLHEAINCSHLLP